MNREYIINDTKHPHYGCFGTISEDERIQSTQQYIMHMTECVHGGQRCAVYYSQVERMPTVR